MSTTRQGTIIVNRGPIFTFYFKVIGVLMIMFVVLAPFRLEYGTGLFLISLVLLVLTLIFLFARRKLEVNLPEKYYNQFVTFPGYKSRNKTTFESIDFIFVNALNATNNFQSGGRSLQAGDIVYKAFLLFNDKSTVMMDSDTDKEFLLERLKKYAEILDVEVMDNTGD